MRTIPMNAFHSVREAKEFLISGIVEEAQREGVMLSETERKMLYFSQTAWTPPDMDTVYEFESANNQHEYEKKIARLIRQAGKRVRRESPKEYDTWWEGIRRLEREDHYLLVMIKQSGLRPRGDLFRLWATGVVVTVGLVFSIAFAVDHGIDVKKWRGSVGLFICGVVIVYQLIRVRRRTYPPRGAKRVEP